MLKRARYYISRTSTEFQENGLGSTFRTLVSFLIRRKFGLQFLLETLEYHLFSHSRNIGKTLKFVAEGESAFLVPKRVLIYASHDPHSQLREHVKQQLEAFRKLEYSIIFVSTSPEMVSDPFLKSTCSLILHRRNIGYDFASWKLGYRLARPHLQRVESLILMNDSCTGPAWDMRELVEKMIREKDSVYGITKSYEIGEYIQSYFIHFGKELIHNGTVDRFFRRVRILRSKWAIVRYLEIGGSRWFKRRGIPLRALVDPALEPVAGLLKQNRATDPVKDPVGSALVQMRLTPFYKRSNVRLRT